MTSDVSQIFSYFTNDSKDPGFTAFQILFKAIFGNSDVLFLLLIAAFQMLSIALVYRRYSSNYWICIFLFVVSTDYLSWMHNGMRQFIAVTIIFAGFRLLVEKKYVPLILLIFLAAQFHGSALLMLPVIFIIQGKAWNIHTVFMLAATMFIVIYIDKFTPVLTDLLTDTQYDGMTTDEIWVVDDGTNILRVLVYSAPALLSLAGIRYIREADDPVINICVNCSIFTMALYAISAVSSGIYIGRLPIYTTLQGYMIIPWLVKRMFTKSSAEMVTGIILALYLAFFYYQMHMGWGVI
jgi:hypothetical protein